MAAQDLQLLLDELSRLEDLRDPTKSDKNHRQFRRFVVRATAELHPMSRSRLDSTPVEVHLRDISRYGAGLISHEPLPIDSGWRLTFLQQGYYIGEQPLVVRHCRPVGQGVYLVGGQFVIATGLMALLGVDDGAIQEGDGVKMMADPAPILPPSEVA